MKASKWIITALIGVAIGFILVAAVNIAIDPFGAFGDHILHYWGYNFSNNTRIAKVEYLMQNKDKYDSFVIGSSKTSPMEPELLNEYFPGASFYNMMMIGVDLDLTEKLLYYIGDNIETKNVIIHLGISELNKFSQEQTDIKLISNPKFAGGSKLEFYSRLFFANPRYSINKVNSYIGRNRLGINELNNIFVPEKGNYNKTERDKENVLNSFNYKATIGGNTFVNFVGFQDPIDYEIVLDSVKRMIAYCEEKGINLMFVSSPNYEMELATYDMNYVGEYWTALAQVTDFWNFSGFTEYSYDARYYYDYAHYRNDLGRMMLARIFDDPDIYVDEDFGYYFTKDNAAELTQKIITKWEYPYAFKNTNEKVKVPILMYHHVVAEGESLANSVVTADKLRSDFEALLEAGYTPVLFEELVDYVYNEGTLPQKPIVITFDDGYYSNYEYVYPLLKEYNMKANFSIIGYSIGLDEHEGTKIIPHYTIDEAKEMEDSGLVEITSHTYDLHAYYVEEDGVRHGVLREDGETESAYYNVIKEDDDALQSLLQSGLGHRANTIVYPSGAANILADTIYRDLGYKVSVLIGSKGNYVQKENIYSLYGLYRMNVNQELSGDKLITAIESLKY